MSDALLIAIVSLLGTLAGSFGGIMTSNKLITYRIEQLEKKLDNYTTSHHELNARVIKLEDNDKLLAERIKNLENMITKG